MNCLTTIVLLATKKKDRDEALALRNKISTFDFVLMLVFQYNILQHINHTAKVLQYPDIKLDQACEWLNKSLKKLIEFRSDEGFEKIKHEAEEVAKTWNIDPHMVKKRTRVVKRFHDELAVDESISDPLYKFKIEIYNNALDIMISQINERFISMKSICKNFSFLSPESLLNYSDEQLSTDAINLSNKYDTDISSSIGIEIISFKNLIKDDLLKNKEIKYIEHLANYLFVDHYILISSFPNLSTAYLLFLTLPVTSVTAERSFSKLKLIKTYLRSTMSQLRLSGLALLSIENKIARALNLEDIIDDFMKIKERRF